MQLQHKCVLVFEDGIQITIFIPEKQSYKVKEILTHIIVYNICCFIIYWQYSLIIYISAIFCTYLFYIRFRGPCIRHLQKHLDYKLYKWGPYWNLIAFFLEVCIIWCIIAYNIYIATLTLIARRYHEYWYLLAYSKDNSMLIVIITTSLQCAQGLIMYCKIRSICSF